MELVVPRNRELSDLLSRASSEDLNVLADLITDFGRGRVALNDLRKRHILMHQEMEDLQAISETLAFEICAYGGNTIVNTLRKEGVPYHELATDVSRKLGGKPSKELDVFAIEDVAIAAAVDFKADGNLVALPRKADDLANVLKPLIAAMVSSAGTLTGIAMSGGTSGLFAAAGGRVSALAAGPVGILAATAAAALQAASPAYRITVPAVLQIAKIRRLQFDTDLTTYRRALLACK